MGLLSLAAVLSLASAGLAAPAAGGQPPVDAALVRDDECAPGDGECGLNALQRRTEKLDTEEETVEVADEPEPREESDEVPLHVLNNASNTIVLANCFERYEVRPGEELQTWLVVAHGFWVLPTSYDFNCTTGCADCFYFQMAWTVKDGAFVRIGFGLESQSQAAGDGEIEKPEGGGMAVNVSGKGSAVAECSDESCKDGWTDPIPVDFDSSTVSITVQGSKTAKKGKDSEQGTVAAMRFRGGGGFRGGGFRGGGFRRPVFRRPIYRRPIYRRPTYRPIYRRPIYAPVTTCAWCYQYGSGTCWWLCR